MSVTSGGVSGNDWSVEPSVSADGRYVVFVSGANNLTGGAAYGVILHDTESGRTIAIGSSAVRDDYARPRPRITADGRYVVFAQAGQPTGSLSVYDRVLGVVIFTTPDGGSWTSMSDDARYFAWTSAADGCNAVLSVYDRLTGQSTRVPGGVQYDDLRFRPTLSPSGRLLMFDKCGSPFLFDRTTGELVALYGRPYRQQSFFQASADDRYVLVGDRSNGNYADVFDRSVSTTMPTTVVGSAISPNGRYVALMGLTYPHLLQYTTRTVRVYDQTRLQRAQVYSQTHDGYSSGRTEMSVDDRGRVTFAEAFDHYSPNDSDWNVFRSCGTAFISPSSQTFGEVGGIGSISTIISSGDACPWTASSNVPWITIASGAIGSGNGSTTYVVSSNPGTAARAGAILIAEQSFTVTQDGTPSSVPAAPVGLTFSTDPSRGPGPTLTLNWNPSSLSAGGAPASYLVEAGSTPGAVDRFHFSVGLNTGFSASVSGTYYVRVRAANVFGAGPPSNEVLVSIGEPANRRMLPPTFTSVSVNGSIVTLNWQASSDSSSGAPFEYVIQAGSSSGRADLGNFSTHSTATTFTTTGVPAGHYYLRVHGSNNAGPGGDSNEAILNVPGGAQACFAPPTRPNGLVFSLIGSTLTLFWNDSVDLPATYVVEVGSSLGLADFATIDTTSINAKFTTAVGSVRPGSYYVRVRARNACGTSPPSNDAIVEIR